MAFPSMLYYCNHLLRDPNLPFSMKLDKAVVQRRLDLMAAEGIVSITSMTLRIEMTVF